MNLDAQMVLSASDIQQKIIIIKTPMLRNSSVDMIDNFNVQKERIAKRFIGNFFLLSLFLTLLAKTSSVNFV